MLGIVVLVEDGSPRHKSKVSLEQVTFAVRDGGKAKVRDISKIRVSNKN